MNRCSLAAALITMLFAAPAPAQPTTRPIPPVEAGAKAALDKSPRHGEWADVKIADPKGDTTVRCWVVYPETPGKAGVVVMIHEIFGLSDWVRATADTLAGEGFIVVAPDLLTGKGPKGGNTDAFASRDDVTKAVRDLRPADVTAALNAVRDYAVKLPSANGKSATVGFCWGGGASFNYAIAQPELDAAVVYYGTNPSDPKQVEKIKAAVLGLYGADDARVVATIAPADAAMKAAGKSYVHHEYDGAGHGFVRQQDGRDGANLRAAQQGWAETVAFLKARLGDGK